MSLDDLRSHPWDASYPPSLWEGEPPEEPPPPPPPPPSAPGDNSTKAEIVAWLLDNGVSLTEDALMALTKAELLDLVADIVDGEVEPDG